MQLDVATDRLPSDSPIKPQLNHILELMSRVTADGRRRYKECSRAIAIPCVWNRHLRRSKRSSKIRGLDRQSNSVFAVEGRTRPLHPLIRDELLSGRPRSGD